MGAATLCARLDGMKHAIQETAGALVLRMGEDLFGITLLDDASLIYEDEEG